MTEEGVRYAARHIYFDTTKAREELGLPQTPFEDSVARSAEWFRSRGLAT